MTSSLSLLTGSLAVSLFLQKAAKLSNFNPPPSSPPTLRLVGNFDYLSLKRIKDLGPYSEPAKLAVQRKRKDA